MRESIVLLIRYYVQSLYDFFAFFSRCQDIVSKGKIIQSKFQKEVMDDVYFRK